MKIPTYEEYSKIFDLVSDETIAPGNIDFIRAVSNYLSAGCRVVDVGGGTGYFTLKLLEIYPYIQLTFIEPSPRMMDIAKQRLPERTIFYQEKFGAVLEKIEKQDIFIFQRCLYSFYDNLDDYKILAKGIYEKTRLGGHIAISEMEGRMDIKEMIKHLENHSKLDLDESEFEEMRKIYERVLEEFNEGVDSGIFTIFSEKDMLDVFCGAGFSLVHSWNGNYFFKKGYLNYLIRSLKTFLTSPPGIFLVFFLRCLRCRGCGI